MGGKDYVPGSDADFNTWFRNLRQYVLSKCNPPDAPQWSHIPAGALTELTDTYTAWSAAYEKTLTPCTKPDRDEKNRVRAVSEKFLRTFVNAYLRFAPAVTDDDKEQMGLHIPDTTPTPVPPPTMQAEADVAYPGVHLIELTRIRAVKTLENDARSDYGVRIYWGILGEEALHDMFRLSAPPVTGDDLPHSVFTRKKKHLFDFSGDSGKTAWFCLRFENAKGASGPFGPLFSAIIP